MSGILRYEVIKTEYGAHTLNVSCNDIVLEFDLSDFFSDKNYIENLFVYINEYVSTLSVSTQQEIFNTFYKLYINKSENLNFNDQQTIDKLENKIAKVSNLLNFNNFKLWLSWKQDLLYFPDNIKNEFIFDPDMNVTKEKTYTRKEYMDLVGSIMFIRAMLPLYIDFYNYIKQVTNQYYYKLILLFIKSDIFVCEEFNKLKEYIESIQVSIEDTGNKNEYLIINKGLSDDDVVDSIIGEIIFGKLITIDFFNKKSNIISFIFQTIKYKSNFASTDGVIIRSKTIKDDPSKEDISYFEDYRKTSNITLGTIVEIQYALDNTQLLLSTLGYKDIDLEKYKEEIGRTHLLMNRKINKVQIILLGWFLHKFINPRALYYIEIKKLIELLTIASIVLWENNHHFMSILMTSYMNQEENYINVLFKYTVNKNIIKQLTPHYSLTVEEDKPSLLEKTINEIVKEITSSTWIPTTDPSKLSVIKSQKNILSMPSNINDLVCNYIEFINKNI
ncbi:MAG: hypothetical protein ACD_33C00026G0004 [uncultured bacterium]|nr:MAG: hypothetical protein ACD_33C00026G0004 [uncultured bacterium]